MRVKQHFLKAKSRNEILAKKFHLQASRLVDKHIEAFARSLKLQAQIIAQKNKADIVLSNHVEDAINRLNSHSNSLSQNLLIIIGSTLLGIFIQEFITEIFHGNITMLGIYIILGFLGFFLVVCAIR